MASSYKSLDSDIITLRQIYVRTAINGFVPNQHILISDGVGAANWGPLSTIQIPPYNAIRDQFGSTMNATQTENVIPISTLGIQGLFSAYVDQTTSTLNFSNAAPNTLVALNSVPAVTRLAATTVPSPENIFYSTGQSTLKFIGVGDIQLSTITDLRTVFIGISSFTASGYADLSAETRAWRGYVYSTNSTSAGYATFISSIPFSTTVGTSSWDWTGSLGSNIPLSTQEVYPNYTTGDVYFSTVQFQMDPFLRYIHPNSTTQMTLDVTPNYFFQRMFLGNSTPLHLVKEFSTFVQYESPVTGRQILSKASVGGWLTSQMSNAYASNYFNGTIKLELDPAVVMSNYMTDGPGGGYYTLYHRIPAGMAFLQDDGYCGYVIGWRGGFSNQEITFDNRTPLSNSVYLHVYNQQGAAPPMPGP
jgi:hypothetical protein